MFLCSQPTSKKPADSHAVCGCTVHVFCEGSYKVRGILNQLRHFRRIHSTPTEQALVTLSAGNYGKAFAYLTSEFRRRLVLMPTTAPDSRQSIIEVDL